jgi:light-regulated signal transduction histidine kinase (bacteriophytochrome)
MTDVSTVDLTTCDREPIHIPGAIQPHGMLLVTDATTGLLRQVAGDIERRLGVEAIAPGTPLAALIGTQLAERCLAVAPGPVGGYFGTIKAAAGEWLDVSAHRNTEVVLVELEPAPAEPSAAAPALAALEAAAIVLQQADTMQALCDCAAALFRDLTGFDRVMIYQFLDDEAGRVVAEARRSDLHSFLHHHFPASDIPRQARALYVRNLVRVIPDAGYQPQPLRPPMSQPLDLSDCALRSVSPVHLEYLRNMGVAASASISIVVDGRLWGLVACHHDVPRELSFAARSSSRALAVAFAQQVKAREEADFYRERIRLGRFAPGVVSVIARDGPLQSALGNHLTEIQTMFRGDGLVAVRGCELLSVGRSPPEQALRPLIDWLVSRAPRTPVFSTDRLSTFFPDERLRTLGSGVLSIVISAAEPWLVIWFRAEESEVVSWAGDPHKPAEPVGGRLTPRASFAAWQEVVHGRARAWSLAEIEAAGQLRATIIEARQTWRVRDLNRQLAAAMKDKDLLLDQKQYLINEANHRIQNSLQLVASFLGLQRRASADPALQAALDEAARRLGAVALLHQRLYRGDAIETVDASRYVEDLCREAVSAMGPEWDGQLSLDLGPAALSPDQAKSLGLIVTELLINANKYAYDGGAGPIRISLSEERNTLRLVVADQGRGGVLPGKGFGSRMIDAMVAQLRGTLEYEPNDPGLRATLKVPLTPV